MMKRAVKFEEEQSLPAVMCAVVPASSLEQVPLRPAMFLPVLWGLWEREWASEL